MTKEPWRIENSGTLTLKSPQPNTRFRNVETVPFETSEIKHFYYSLQNSIFHSLIELDYNKKFNQNYQVLKNETKHLISSVRKHSILTPNGNFSLCYLFQKLSGYLPLNWITFKSVNMAAESQTSQCNYTHYEVLLQQPGKRKTGDFLHIQGIEGAP